MHLPRSAVLFLLMAVFLFPAVAHGEETGAEVGESGDRKSTVREVEDPDDPRWCRTCHEEERYTAEAMRRGAHKKVSCSECHTGYGFNPHEKVEGPADLDLSVLESRKVIAPEAYAACSDCHEELPGEKIGMFPHGKGDPAKGPYCDDCHGDAHTTPKTEKMTEAERRLAMNARCEKCHEDPDLAEEAGLTEGIVEGFHHTTHARLLALGSDDVPGCADCHGGHEMKDLEKVGDEICKDCHDDSSPAFVALASHGPFTPEGRPIGYWVQKMFAWLTFLTVMFFAGHILLDLFATFRKALRDGPPPKDEIERAERLLKAAGLTHRHGGVQRFDFHQRTQHMVLAISFVLLVLTGWPLTTHGVGASHALMELFGGPHGAALWHRIAGVGLAFAAVYHLAYIATLAIRRKPCMTMMPSPQDLRDMLGNFAFFLGLRQNRPRFTRYGYLEKFDYWAVFWGMTIMVGTGVVRWFPAEFARIAPAWLYEASNVAHTDEALLASMAIFFWHFYNVHLRPAVFPMSWVFIHGRASVHEMEEAHGAELDEMLARARAMVPPPGPGEGGKGEAA